MEATRERNGLRLGLPSAGEGCVSHDWRREEDAHTDVVRIRQPGPDSGDQDTCRREARAETEDRMAIVENMENGVAGLTRIANALGPVMSRHHGYCFGLRPHTNPASSASTANALALHIVVPSKDTAPSGERRLRGSHVDRGFLHETDRPLMPGTAS
jgi:hypothetical protein